MPAEELYCKSPVISKVSEMQMGETSPVFAMPEEKLEQIKEQQNLQIKDHLKEVKVKL